MLPQLFFLVESEEYARRLIPHKELLIILPDILISLLEKLLILVQLVLEQNLAQRFADFTLAGAGVLPTVETDQAHDFVNGFRLLAITNSHSQIIQKFRSWLHAGNEKMIAGTGASDVEQVSFCVVNFLQIGGVGHFFDAGL